MLPPFQLVLLLNNNHYLIDNPDKVEKKNLEKIYGSSFGFGFMVSKVTFKNISAISWRSVLLVEETGVPG